MYYVLLFLLGSYQLFYAEDEGGGFLIRHFGSRQHCVTSDNGAVVTFIDVRTGKALEKFLYLLSAKTLE
jgi:hypothetical protein